MPDDRELGLETLLAVRTELGVGLDDGFLEACFNIQKKYQFNHERILSTNAMNRIIDDRVETTGSKQNKNGS